MAVFREQLKRLIGEGLSTKAAADIAARLTRGIYEPISSQIDPLKLAEFHRANNIMKAYGARLAEKGGNTKSTSALLSLTGQYPSHGFVIDRKEARGIFKTVESPKGELLAASKYASVQSKKILEDFSQWVARETLELRV